MFANYTTIINSNLKIFATYLLVTKKWLYKPKMKMRISECSYIIIRHSSSSLRIYFKLIPRFRILLIV
ncbi:hypothetical protein BpHYR1_042527 [Brachionus plicatilis]|uniref:Uncharacterized protein n=1 Tax=Brachionus plicatilis TaxID=10195 RepID=A0A3M7PQ01_BRAPC|nr:hypothetical protein BpHYR1_042527 [Brachionus plicatilis]